MYVQSTAAVQNTVSLFIYIVRSYILCQQQSHLPNNSKNGEKICLETFLIFFFRQYKINLMISSTWKTTILKFYHKGNSSFHLLQKCIYNVYLWKPKKIYHIIVYHITPTRDNTFIAPVAFHITHFSDTCTISWFSILF